MTGPDGDFFGGLTEAAADFPNFVRKARPIFAQYISEWLEMTSPDETPEKAKTTKRKLKYMKTNKVIRRPFLTKAALTGIALTALLGAFTVPASAGSSSASYEYHIGDAFLVSLNPAFGPDVALAPNGATMTITGTGTLSVHPKSVSGGGTFSYADAAGNVLASGTWTSRALLSFKVYGTSPILPPTFIAGKAYVRVHLSPQAGGAGFDAVLTITCALPQVKVPLSAEEGIRLAVERIGNFNDEVSGNTLFVSLP